MNKQEKIKITAELQAEMQRQSREWMYADQNRKIEKFHSLNELAQPGGIVFVGDSITESYPIHELFDGKISMYNRGISGYTSAQMRKHLKEMVFELNPSKVFLLIGTNDLEFDITPLQVIENIQFISNQIIEKGLNIVVYLLSIYPVDESHPNVGKRTNKDIDFINQEIKHYAVLHDSIQYIDVAKVLSMNGRLNQKYTFDGLHLNMAGYQVVSKVLSNYLK